MSVVIFLSGTRFVSLERQESLLVARGLTLPSRGRATSGFAGCRPPLMSNVRRPMKREDTRFHGAVVRRAVAAAAGSQQKRVEHHPRQSARAVRALPASEPLVPIPDQSPPLPKCCRCARCLQRPPALRRPRRHCAAVTRSTGLVAPVEGRSSGSAGPFARLVTHEERGARCLLRTSRLQCGWHLRAQSPTMRTPSPVGIQHAHTGA